MLFRSRDKSEFQKKNPSFQIQSNSFQIFSENKSIFFTLKSFQLIHIFFKSPHYLFQNSDLSLSKIYHISSKLNYIFYFIFFNSIFLSYLFQFFENPPPIPLNLGSASPLLHQQLHLALLLSLSFLFFCLRTSKPLNLVCFSMITKPYPLRSWLLKENNPLQEARKRIF